MGDKMNEYDDDLKKREFLMQKLGLSNYDESRSNIASNRPNGWTALQSGLAAISAGLGGKDPVQAAQGVWKDEQGALDNSIKDFDRSRERKIQEYGLGRTLDKDMREDEILARENDPNSEDSVMYQGLANEYIPGDYKGKSASSIKDKMGILQKLAELRAQKEKGILDREDRALARQDRKFLLQNSHADRQDKIDLRNEEKLEKNVQAFEKNISGTQNLADAIGNVENILGATLDNIKIKNDNLYINGQKKDLPGVSVPGIGRVSGYNTDARNLSGSIGTIFNTVLKDRAGAAVTNPEMERLKTEFNAGKYNSEAEMIGALQRYKGAVGRALQNKEAAFSPEVVDRYKSRGGFTSEQLAPKADKKQRLSQIEERLNYLKSQR